MADTKREKDPNPADYCKEPVTHALAQSATADVVFVGDDGIQLFPQPITNDRLDPLSWSFAQKHSVLAILMALYVASIMLAPNVELSAIRTVIQLANQALGCSLIS